MASVSLPKSPVSSLLGNEANPQPCTSGPLWVCAVQRRRFPVGANPTVEAKIFGSEAAVRVITDLMRVVGIDSYDHEAPFARLLQDALALPIFDGGNMGIRRRQLHTMFKRSDYDPLAASGAT